MADISHNDIKDEYDDVIGTNFIIIEQQSDIRGTFQEKTIIYIRYGEIFETIKTGVGHYDIDEDKKLYVLEIALRTFLDIAPNEFKYIVEKLNENSIGYKIAEKIIDSKIDKLEEQTKTLKLMKRR